VSPSRYDDELWELVPKEPGPPPEHLHEFVASLGHAERVLDLGCGDGRLVSLVLEARAEVAEAIGLDNSPPMLELARQRFAADDRVTIEEHDLGRPLSVPGPFDVVLSGFAIHHLPDARKRSLFEEIHDLLRPGGVFVNLEVVQCATPELHEEFNRRIERPGGDPEDVLAPVDVQLEWMRAAGLAQVDCNWRWRGFAVLVGQRAVTTTRRLSRGRRRA
jgi:SAM-dependent methyltransferase